MELDSKRVFVLKEKKLSAAPVKVQVHRSSTGSFEKHFSPIIVGLQMVGMDLLPLRKVSTSANKHFLYQCPKYFSILVLGLQLPYYVYDSVVSPKKEKKLTCLCEGILQTFMYFSFCTRREKFHSLLEMLWNVSRSARCSVNTEQIRRTFLRFIGAFCCLVALNAATICWELKENFLDGMDWNNACFISHQKWICLFFANNRIVYLSQSFLRMGFVAAFYFSICDQLKKCCVDLIHQVKTLKGGHERLVGVYEDVNDVFQLVDDAFSLPILLTICECCTFLFWTGYDFAFNPRISTRKVLTYFLLISMSAPISVKLLWSASLATESADLLRGRIMSLSGAVPQHYHEIEVLIKRNSYRRSKLTLWKMFDIKRSIVICLSGSLLTYGILLGTLGNVND